MLKFMKNAGRRRDIVKSSSFNNEHSDVINASNASDKEILLLIEQQALNDQNFESPNIISKISRILSDKSCLVYFVQYLEREAALPLVRFWLDVESFRSSIEPLQRHQYQQNLFKSSHIKNDRNGGRSMRRSISFDEIVTSNQTDFCNAYKSDDCYYTENSPSDLPTERDDGDGSSDANSMANLSDICETEIEFYENGRKSATGASSHGDCMDSTSEQSACNVKKYLPTSSIIDAIRIFKKYLLNGEITDLVQIPTNILSQISLKLCVQNDPMTKSVHTDAIDSQIASSNESIMTKAKFEESNISTVFDEAQAFILDHLDEHYTNGFLQSQFFYRYCKENIGSNLKISDILYNETALFYFMEFLELQSKQKYLEFWLAATNYRRQWDNAQWPQTNEAIDVTNRNKQNQNDALILYEKYFSLQATHPLDLSDRIRYHVEEKICSIDECAMVQYCFDLPLVIVERFLDERFMRTFEKSNLFFKYLNEMLHKFETTISTLTFSPGIDDGLTLNYSSENPSSKIDSKGNSISTKNTYLAMENIKKRNHRRIPSAGNDMCIDSRQLHDPDLLWRRNTTNGLIFGRVNSLGRYERDYDITPIDKNSANTVPGSLSYDANQILQNTGNKIKRAVRKLVHLPEQCMQEELAWQMAEMIINDVTSVTLKPNQSPISK